MNPADGVKSAADIAQSQFVFGILFIILLALVLWGTKLTIEKLRQENQNMEDKNDAVIEKIETLHLERQTQLHQMMVENKQESKEREAQLMTHNNTLLVQLQSQTASLEEINRTQSSMQETQAKMQENLSKIEQRIEMIEAAKENK